ncbi:hypothetical protein V6N13_033955 [Hibiscus sabdariffa]
MKGGGALETDEHAFVGYPPQYYVVGEIKPNAVLGHFLALKRKSAGVKAWLATLPFGPNVSSSELVIWRRANPLIDVENVGISEPEMPGGFKSWRRLGMKAIFLRGAKASAIALSVTSIVANALKVSLVPVMWSTEIGGHLSCPYYVVEASAVLFLEPSEGDVCVPSNFRGVCYVKVIRLTMEVVSAMDGGVWWGFFPYRMRFGGGFWRCTRVGNVSKAVSGNPSQSEPNV